MDLFKPLIKSLTPLATQISPCFYKELLLPMTVNHEKATSSLTLTDNTGFALTTVNTINTWPKSLFLNRSIVNDDC